MVYCVVAGCYSRTEATKSRPRFDGSFHCLPSDPNIRRQWIMRINRQDAEWTKFLSKEKCGDKTPRKLVCSRHFEESDYCISQTMAQQLGFKPGKFNLKSDAVPSINMGKSAGNSTDPEAGPAPKKIRMAAVKRDNMRVSNTCTGMANIYFFNHCYRYNLLNLCCWFFFLKISHDFAGDGSSRCREQRVNGSPGAN